MSGARSRVWRGASFAAPFLLVAIALRLAAPGVGDRIARRLVRFVAILPRASIFAPGGQAAANKHRSLADLLPRAPCRVDAGEGGSPIEVHVPSALVTSIIEDNGRRLHPSTVRGPDGEATGVRVGGLSSLRAGLEDDDVIVCVEGESTPDEDAVIDASLEAIARGLLSLHARAVRGDRTVSIAADWPTARTGPGVGKAR